MAGGFQPPNGFKPAKPQQPFKMGEQSVGFSNGFEKRAFFEKAKRKYDEIMGKKGAHKHFDPKDEKHVRALLRAQGIQYPGHQRYWKDEELGLV